MTNDISELLLDAGILLLVGMSVVFCFLAILILVIKGIEKLDNALPQPEHVLSGVAPVTNQANGAVPPHHIASITAAIHQHKKNQ